MKCGDIMIRTFKVEIKPTKQQRELFAQAFGYRRYAWNWGLDKHEKVYLEFGKSVGPYGLDTQFNEAHQGEEFAWTKNVNSMIKTSALVDLGESIKAWYRYLREAKHTSNKVNINKGRPKFKKKGVCEETFRIFAKTPETFKVQSKYHLNFNWTRSIGRLTVRTAEPIDFLKDTGVKTMTITRQGGKYFMSLTYEKTNRRPKCKEGVVGCDLGVSHAVVTHDGQETKFFDVPNTLKKQEELFSKRQARLSRKTKDSKSYNKQKLLVEKSGVKQVRIRRDFAHKLTSWLVSNYSEIKIDDFSFAEYIQSDPQAQFIKSKTRNRSAYRVAPCQIKEMLTYKAEETGSVIKYVPKFTRSTQTCCRCGHVFEGDHKLTLKDRWYDCPDCGSHIKRDENSAIFVYKLPIE